MRFFIVKNGAVVVEKQSIVGDDDQINALVDRYKTNHPALTVLELDHATFDATVCVPALTTAQIAWAAFKAQLPQPTALQAIIFIAKYLGLE